MRWWPDASDILLSEQPYNWRIINWIQWWMRMEDREWPQRGSRLRFVHLCVCVIVYCHLWSIFSPFPWLTKWMRYFPFMHAHTSQQLSGNALLYSHLYNLALKAPIIKVSHFLETKFIYVLFVQLNTLNTLLHHDDTFTSGKPICFDAVFWEFCFQNIRQPLGCRRKI